MKQNYNMIMFKFDLYIYKLGAMNVFGTPATLTTCSNFTKWTTISNILLLGNFIYNIVS